MLTLSLLGRPVLVAAGQPVSLTIRKTWALLVLLALGGAAPRPRVGAALWPGLDERTARRNLRRELARLREAGVPGLLQVEGDFLVLAPAVALDTRQFDAALHAGQPGQALALWRGPLADGLRTGDTPEFDDWLAAEREAWRARWRGALEAAAVAAEAARAPEQAIAHLHTLLADDPLHERHHAAVMRLHGAAGRREAALAQYERCRAVLAAELGLQPMADTEALAAALRGATGLVPAADALATSSPPAAGWADGMAEASGGQAELPDALPFVGRGAEVAALEAAWQAGRAVLIEGEGGVGKTRLALDFAAAHGPYALARCRPGDAEVPYAAFTRALRALAGPTPQLHGQPAWVSEELSRLLPELGAAPPPIRSAEERSRFFDACARGWLALAADDFDAVVLDDWHHADAASRSLLAFVARRRRETGDGRGAREWLLMRPELDVGTLQQLLAGMHALHLPLQPLPDEAVFELVQRLSGARQPRRFAARLQQATAGNPFFLAETLRHLAEQRLLQVGDDGAWRTPFDDATQDYRELPVPASVVDAVLARVQRLPGAARRVLEAAALAAEPLAPALLAPACALSELDTVLAIEQAVQASLLREHETGGFAFAHDLVQQALDSSLSNERRRLVHRRLALGAEAAGAAPAVVAAHFEASGEPQRAVPWRLAAGDQALRLHALAEAAQQWQAGLADEPTPGQALALRLRLVRVTLRRDDREANRAHVVALQALAADGLLNSDERLQALIAAAGALAQTEDAHAALRLLDGLPADLDETQAAHALCARVAALRESGRIEASVETANAALALPALQGRERAELLDQLVMAEHLAGRVQAALARCEEALALCEQLGDPGGIARGHSRRGVFLLETGDAAGGEAELLLAAASYSRLGLIGNHRGSLFNLCCLYSAQSRPERVLAMAQQCWNLQPPMQPSELRVMVRLAFVDAHLALGDLGAAWAHAEPAVHEALQVQEQVGLAGTAMSTLELLGLLGEHALASELLARIDKAVMRQMPQAAHEMWLALAQYELLRGDPAAARAALAEVDTLAGLDNERIRVRAALVEAQLRLAEGDAAVALAALPADDAAGHNDEMRVRVLALRVAGEAALGTLSPDTLAAARAALAGPQAHASAALGLHHALARAQGARRRRAGPARVAHATFVDRLAQSLQAHPAQRAAFQRAWA